MIIWCMYCDIHEGIYSDLVCVCSVIRELRRLSLIFGVCLLHIIINVCCVHVHVRVCVFMIILCIFASTIKPVYSGH